MALPPCRRLAENRRKKFFPESGLLNPCFVCAEPQRSWPPLLASILLALASFGGPTDEAEKSLIESWRLRSPLTLAIPA